MNIVAIDPSFRNMAFVEAEFNFGATENYADPFNLEVIGYHLEQTRNPETGSKRENDWNIARDLADTVKAFTENADVVFIEQPVGSQSARSAWTLGITLGLLASIRKPVLTYSARQVKQNFTGNPKATKEDMITKAMKTFAYVEMPGYKQKGQMKINAGKAEHIADALGTLYTGIRSKEFHQFYEAHT